MRIIRTLEAMAEVYRLPAGGAAASPRFERYVAMSRAGVPIAGYNPMTGQDALGTVEALLAIDAERVAADAACACATRLGFEGELELVVTVATPGLWTDRLATEVEHRLGGRTWTQMLFWTGEDGVIEDVRREAVAQTVRAAWAATHGPPATVAMAAGQEGLALALAGGAESALDPAVVEALEVLGEDESLASKASLLYGDETARALGWTPLGLGPGAGYRHSVARATEALTVRSPGDLLRSAWTPVTPAAPGLPSVK